MGAEESKERYGYCDLHLEAKLVSCGSLIAGQYGGDKADCNPFEYWRCSRPDCCRCYEPYMFGYFNLDRNRGAGIQTNHELQERCGHHERTPFMCIGRFGRQRRFRCPMHGCDSVGSTVAECVADVDEVEEELHATPTLTGDDRKAAFELATFNEFTKAAGFRVESAENAKPPQPDIRCRIDGEERWFELGRITDTKLAKTLRRVASRSRTLFVLTEGTVRANH